jgi:hypothetical protein
VRTSSHHNPRNHRSATRKITQAEIVSQVGNAHVRKSNSSSTATRCSEGTFRPSPDGAGCGLTCGLAVLMVADCGLA